MGTIGLDFGTHQTKICYEDRSDKLNPKYTFFKFADLNGEEQIILPSVVQINEDDTVSYGFVDESKCKCLRVPNKYKKPIKPDIPKPQLRLREKPLKPNLPPKPKKTLSDWKNKLLAISLHKEVKDVVEIWKQECDRIEESYNFELSKWRKECLELTSEYDKQVAEYDSVMNEYEKNLKIWEDNNNNFNKLSFRYFKQATFADFNWKGSISPTLLSIWYLAFILFDLENAYGQTFSTQMGIPTGSERFEKNKIRTVSVLLTAFYLVEDVFSGDKEAFLATKYTDLEKLTKWQQYNKKRKDDMGILVFPEAYASLRAITTKGKLESGMNLLIDIGGGTTDISFFIIDVESKTYEPIIYSFYSISKGINYIIEKASSTRSIDMSHHKSLDSIDLDKKNLEQAKQLYHLEINKVCNKLVEELYMNFVKKKRTRQELASRFANRPVVYTGGGSTFNDMRIAVNDFNQIRHMDGYYWKNMSVDDFSYITENGLCPILSVALGLSVSQDKDDVQIYPIEEIFSHIKPISKIEPDAQHDYLLQDF